MTALYNELEPYAVAWLKNLSERGLIAPGVVDGRSIKDLAADDLVGRVQAHFFAGIGVWSYALRLAGWPDDAPVWTGSCPCQPFSAAGKGAGFADERHLWPVWFELIRQCRPPVVFGEQVEGKDGRAWLDLVSSDLEGIGYAFGAAILPAAGVGAPHIRHRTFFVAYADDARPQGRIGVHGGPAECAPGARGVAGGLADDARNGRREERPDAGGGAAGDCAEGRAAGPGAGGGPVGGFWRDAEWIFCRDGKCRPVEPGTFPLVDGSAFELGRGGRLRRQIARGDAQSLRQRHQPVGGGGVRSSGDGVGGAAMTLRENHPELHAALEDAKSARAAREADLDKAIRRACSGEETDSEIARRMRVGIRRVQRIRRGE